MLEPNHNKRKVSVSPGAWLGEEPRSAKSMNQCAAKVLFMACVKTCVRRNAPRGAGRWGCYRIKKQTRAGTNQKASQQAVGRRGVVCERRCVCVAQDMCRKRKRACAERKSVRNAARVAKEQVGMPYGERVR